MPLESVLPLAPIKSLWAPKNAVQRIYIKSGNTKRPGMYAVDGQHKNAYTYIYAWEQIVKSVTSGYNLITLVK